MVIVMDGKDMEKRKDERSASCTLSIDEFKQFKAEYLRLLQEGEEHRLKELRNIREHLGS